MNITIPYSSYSETIVDGWLVVSFNHVLSKNAKLVKTLGKGSRNVRRDKNRAS